MSNTLLNANGKPANEEIQLVSPTGAPLTEPKSEQLNLVPFDDGYVYKFSENPARKGTFVMHTVDGNVVAVLPDPRVANLLCEAMRMLFLANQQVQQPAEGLGAPLKEGDAVPEFAKEKTSQPVVFES